MDLQSGDSANVTFQRAEDGVQLATIVNAVWR